MHINVQNISLNSAYIIRFCCLTIVFSSNVMNEQTVMNEQAQKDGQRNNFLQNFI